MDGQRAATTQKEIQAFPFLWSPRTVCIESCVDDQVVQNGFVVSYFMFVSKPFFPVSNGCIISVLIFVEVPLTMLSLKSFVKGR